MTLITHIRNSRIAIIAGDSKINSVIPRDDEYIVKKVFDFKDCILGYYGNNTNFQGWLTNGLKQDNIRLDIRFEQIINEVRNEYSNPRSFGIVIAGFEKSVLVSHPTKNEFDEIDLELGCNLDHEMYGNISKGVFFSPQRTQEWKIDNKHNDSLFSLFVKRFYDVYNHEFDLELIQNDAKLECLLSLFHNTINKKSKLHRNMIGGPVKYHVIDFKSKKISHLKTCRSF